MKPLSSLIIIFFLVECNISFSQDSTQFFLTNLCEFNTDGTGKSMGLRIKISTPCVWYQKDGERPHIIKNFSYGSDINSGRLVITFGIRALPNFLSKTEIDELLSEEEVKKAVNSFGTFISYRKIKIDGLDCAEVYYKMSQEMPVGKAYGYGLYYQIFYKDKIISLTNGTVSSSDEKSSKIFEQYKTLFQILASKTIIISQWE